MHLICTIPEGKGVDGTVNKETEIIMGLSIKARHIQMPRNEDEWEPHKDTVVLCLGRSNKNIIFCFFYWVQKFLNPIFQAYFYNVLQ